MHTKGKGRGLVEESLKVPEDSGNAVDATDVESSKRELEAAGDDAASLSREKVALPPLTPPPASPLLRQQRPEESESRLRESNSKLENELHASKVSVCDY